MELYISIGWKKALEYFHNIKYVDWGGMLQKETH